MSKPNMYCGECPYWLAFGEPETTDEQNEAILENCRACPCTKGQKVYLMHIPTQCCYPLEPDGKTIIVAGIRLTPKVDGEVFWKYTDTYVEKIVTPTDPFHRGEQ